MKQQNTNAVVTGQIAKQCRRAFFVAVAAGTVASTSLAAEFEVIADTPTSFRANFTGVDTDPLSPSAGNDFAVTQFKFWTVLVNLRGDSVDQSGNASGYYEIQLTHSGTALENPLAPVLKTFLFYANLQPGTMLMDDGVSSGSAGAGAEYLTTLVNIEYEPLANVVTYNGAIAGDSDLDGDQVLDSLEFDEVIKALQDLKDERIISGQEQGQIIKQTRTIVKDGGK